MASTPRPASMKTGEGRATDPTRLTLSALQNAASISALMLTTEAMICEIPEKGTPGATGGGQMPGMDYESHEGVSMRVTQASAGSHPGRLRANLQLSAKHSDAVDGPRSLFACSADIVVAGSTGHQPYVPVTSHRDVFGNWCSRIVAPAGRIK